VPIQLAQCRFRGLAISNAEISLYFSNEIIRRKRFYQTALGNCYDLKLPKCQLQLAREKKLSCHLLQFSAHFRSPQRPGASSRSAEEVFDAFIGDDRLRLVIPAAVGELRRPFPEEKLRAALLPQEELGPPTLLYRTEGPKRIRRPRPPLVLPCPRLAAVGGGGPQSSTC